MHPCRVGTTGEMSMNNPWIQRIEKSHRKVAHEALDEAIDEVKTVRARPVWRAVSAR